MMRFDPSVGWTPSDREAHEAAGAPQGEDAPADAPTDAAQAHPASLYHFNRQGVRLNVTRVEDGPTPPAAPSPADADRAVPPVVQRVHEATARPSPESLRAPAETAGMVRELFERLDQADGSQALLASVADNLKRLDHLATQKGQLERVLADIKKEMDQLQTQVRTDLTAARDSEERNLKLRQYRRELLDQLARRLPVAGKP